MKAPELRALRQGQREAQRGEEVLSPLERLSTERGWQEAWAPEQAEALGRARYERRTQTPGDRTGSEAGTLKPAAGGRRVKRPPGRGREEPSQSQLWRPRASPSEVRNRFLVERDVGGLAQRDLEDR